MSKLIKLFYCLMHLGICWATKPTERSGSVGRWVWHRRECFLHGQCKYCLGIVTPGQIEQCFLALSCNKVTVLPTLQLLVTFEFPFSCFRHTMLMFLALICPQIWSTLHFKHMKTRKAVRFVDFYFVWIILGHKEICVVKIWHPSCAQPSIQEQLLCCLAP